jgi:hypothetical protein
MQVIVYAHGEGQVAIITPAPEYQDRLIDLAGRHVPDGSLWRIMNSEELPSRDSRNQWRWTDSGPLAVAE